MNFDPLYNLYDWLNATEIGGGLTAFHLVMALVAITVGYSIVKGLLPSGKKKDYLIDVMCNDCGWVGQVSKFTKVCQQCKSLAVRMIKPEEAEVAKRRQRARKR